MRVRLLIHGRVQGINYRYFAKSRARSLGLKGWVRNLDDGRVESVAEGSDEAVQKYIAWCRKGPLFSKVTGVDVKEDPGAGGFSDFSVKY